MSNLTPEKISSMRVEISLLKQQADALRSKGKGIRAADKDREANKLQDQIDAE